MTRRNYGQARLWGTFRAYDEFEASTAAGWLAWLLTNVGAGAASANILGEPGHPGIVRLTTGTTATGRAQIEQGGGSRRLGGGVVMRLSTMVRLSALNGGGQEYLFEFGLCDTFATIPGAGVFFGVDASSPNWLAVATDGIGFNAVDSGVLIVAGQWYRLDIEITDVALAQMSIDGVTVARLDASLPTALQTLRAGYVLEKTLGITARNADVDYFQNVYVFPE